MININYAPAAGVVAGLGLLGGQGEYAQNVNQLLTQQWQTAAQMNNARLIAMQQAAAEAQRQAGQQNFEMQMAPMRSYLDMQNQAFQSQLGSQADAQRQILGAQLGSQQSAQDFGEQQALYAQHAQLQSQNDAARIAQQQQGQLYNQQEMYKFQDDQATSQQFQSDPFAVLRQNQQQAQQSGYDYSPEQQTQIAEAKKNLTAMQSAIKNGQATLPTLLPSIKANMATLSTISANPSVAPPPSMSQRVAKATSWFNPKSQDPSQAISDQYAPGSIPVTIDQKTGKPMVWQGFKPPEMGEIGEDGQVVTAKVAGQNISNQGKQAKINWMRSQEIRKAMREEMEINPMLAQDPNAVQMLRQQLEQEWDAVNGGLAKPVHQNPQPPQQQQAQPPAPGITQQPQQPQGLDMQGIVQRLQATPRDRWTRQDWIVWGQIQQSLMQQQQPQGNPVAQAG